MKNNVFKLIKPFLIRHEPEILMGMGLSGLIFSTVWAVKATVSAVKKLETKKKILGKEKLSVKEVVGETWQLYLPVVISTALAVPAVILGNRVSARRSAALAAAYTLSETALQTYQEKTKEVVGEKKEQEIHEGVSKDSVRNTYAGSTVLLTGDGDSLFFDPLSKRYFKSNWNKMLKAANELNADALGNMTGNVTLADWYEAIGLTPTALADEMGWTVADGPGGLLSISIDSSLTEDNRPCGAIHYINRPKILR